MKVVRLLLPLLLFLSLTACSGGGGSSPTSPTPSARAAVTVTINNITVTRTSTGYTYTFTVTATETAGVAATLTGLNISVIGPTGTRGTLEVSSPFSVTALPARGSLTSRTINAAETSTDPLAATQLTAGVQFSDTSGARTASATAQISPLPTSFTLSGTVSVAFPSGSTRLAGARVEIADGPHAGMSTTTGSDGAYSFGGLTGGLTVMASLNGYQPQSLSATMTQDRTVSFGLKPNQATVDQTYTGEISGGTTTSCSDGIFTKPCATVTFAVYNGGNMEAFLDWTGSADLDLTLWRGSTLLASSRAASGTETVSSFLSAGSYQLRVTYYSGSVIAPYTLRVVRSN